MQVMDKEDSSSKLYINVEVSEPVIFVSPWHVRFTTYQVDINTNHWAFTLAESSTRRRYSEFRWLRQRLHEHHPTLKLPLLPSRKMFVLHKFSQEFLDERCKGLAEFLRSLIKSPVWQSERVLHLFLQSNLSVRDIDANLRGERDDAIVPAINLILVDTPSGGDSLYDDSLSVEEAPHSPSLKKSSSLYLSPFSSENSLYDLDSECEHATTIKEEEELHNEAVKKNSPQMLLVPAPPS